LEGSRVPRGGMRVDGVYRLAAPPTDGPRRGRAFGGWIDAGEAATDAMRFLVRQLAAEPLATIDLEDFVDFTQERPVVRLTAAGERTIRWPRSAFWLWQPPAPRAGLLLFRGLEPQRRWRTYATLLLDVAARCGVQRIVSLGAMLADLPHTRPPRVTGSSTDPHWHAQLEAWGMARRSRYEGPTGIASVLLDAAPRHRVVDLHGPSPPLAPGDDESGDAASAAADGGPPARPGAGCVLPRCGRAGLSDALRPGGGAGRRDPGLCAAA